MTKTFIDTMQMEEDDYSILNSGINFHEYLFEQYEQLFLEELSCYRTDLTANYKIRPLFEVGLLPSIDEISKPGSLYEFSIDQRIYTEKLLGKPSEGPSPPYMYN